MEDPQGRKTRYAYDEAGNKTEYEYDKNGNVTSVADSIGEMTKAVYDKEGNVIESINSAGQKTTFTYDADGNRLTQTSYTETEEGTKEQTTTYIYNEAGDLVQTIDPDGNVTSVERNVLGQMVSTTDEQGRTTKYEYSDNGDVSKIFYEDGTTETFAYDAERRVTESVNRLGQKVSHVYDKVGNLLRSTDSRGNATTYKYDKNYNVLSVTSATGATTSYTYDELNRNTSVTDAEGNTTTFAYDKYSRQTSMTDAKGNVTKYEYNEAGNKTKTIYADGSFVTAGYDERGRTVWQEDMAGIKTEYTYDSADRLVMVESETTGATKYTYDTNGNLASVEDANGNIVAYEYDEQGRLVKTIQPDGSVSTTSYDDLGRVNSEVDYNGVETTYEYDEQDHVIKAIKGESVQTYTYDDFGRLTETKAGDSVIRYSYNKQGELSEKTYENGQKINYGYDTFGRMDEVTVSHGEKVLDKTNYDYDAMNRIVRVIAKDGTATVYTYDENGNRKSATFANGVTLTYEYDTLNRLLVQKTVDSTGELIAQYTYTLGKNGERTHVLEEGIAGSREISYEYDDAGRLVKEEISGDDSDVAYIYTYDKVGNRLSKVVKGETTITTEYHYNRRNQLTAEVVDGQETIYSYDANGNLLNQSGVIGNKTYQYDVYNRLIGYEDAEGVKETYTYDAEGVRRSKTTVKGDEISTIFFVSDTTSDLSRTLAETDGDGNLLASYTWGDMLLAQNRGAKVSTYLYDGHGDVRGLLNEKGELTDTYSYNAYGELISRSGETENHYLYTGEYYDSTTNLYYLRARYMNPNTGTFISMDTYQGNMYEPVTLHKYLYANANPVKYTDPSGMFSISDLSTAASMQSILQNKTTIMAWGMLNGVGHATVTAMCGGTPEEIAKSFRMGFLIGAGLSMMVCGLVLINVIGLATATAIIATAALSTGLVVTTLLIVLVVYSVITGDSQMLGIYTSLLILAVTGTCVAYGAYGVITVSGENGTQQVNTAELKSSGEKIVNRGKGWRVGEPIDNLTKAGKEPSWTTVRSRYWKNEAHYSADLYSEQNLNMMRQGKAPKHCEIDVSLELHHINGRNIENPHNIENLKAVWPWEHAEIDPYRYYTGPRP